MKNIYKLFGALVMIMLCNQISAQTAYGYACAGFGALTPGHLYSFDIDTGAPTDLGAISCSNNPLTGEFINGQFYLTDGDVIFPVDMTATCGTAVTITGSAVGCGTETGLSHDLSSGITYFLCSDGSSTTLHIIDVDSGVTTLVGTLTGVPIGITLIIDDMGNAWVIEINSDAIFPVSLVDASVGPAVPLVGLSTSFAQDADFDCNGDGAIVGGFYTGGGISPYGTLDPATGVFTQITDLGHEVCGFSVDCRAEVAVPTLGQWGLILLSLGFLAFGSALVYTRRKVFA